MDRLVARTGKVYSFVWYVTAAKSSEQARKQAAVHGIEYGVDWLDKERWFVRGVALRTAATGSIYVLRCDRISPC